jgi:hypothetical protein
MAIILMINHRLAFFALAALFIAAGVPLAYAWARLLPDDPPPFPIEPGSFPTIDEELPQEALSRTKRDLVAIPLLVCVTLAYLIRFPGFPNAVVFRWLNSTVSPAGTAWIIIATRILLITACIAATVYAALRNGPLRIPLAAAATLVLILWLLSPLLTAALLSSS